MRILFSTIKDIGHVTPLVPYARSLRDLGHEVRVATSTDEGAVAALNKAGLAHEPFDRPTPDELQGVMKRVDELKGEEAIAFAFREGFAGIAARAAMPNFSGPFGSFVRISSSANLPSLPRWLPRRRRAFRRPVSPCIAANTSPGSQHRSPERSTSSALWLA
ncbi:hypothetical protein JJE66_01860 [Bradyrhizobium diazoefficiens]|uniref:hypothetical protein n=1 Tax=Bradyrhizobium diazoefficiens TaxID=1355477 RepID=UPI00190978E3|nr:hypothetical protein [Bradyrhizobium diazoefficiens]MBK3660000.1 hypothetical protein [Bradyrhizobium diazoefficiens]